MKTYLVSRIPYKNNRGLMNVAFGSDTYASVLLSPSSGSKTDFTNVFQKTCSVHEKGRSCVSYP